MKKIIVFLLFWAAITSLTYSQTYKVAGIVIAAEDNLPVIGASVIIKGTTTGVITDLNGRFSIEVESNKTIQISFLGFKTYEHQVTSNVENLRVVLEMDAIFLDEVVQIGYGTVKKSDLTGAVSSVSSEQLQKLPAASIDKALQGLSPGVTVISNSGQPGSDMVVRIRGIGTINDASPLFVVDGVPVGDINFLSPNDIKST